MSVVGSETLQAYLSATMPMQPPLLRQQLQEALGSTYTIERELAGGGMSRVFVAEETRFGRRVVIKVLAPELVVGLSAERFEREIRLAAQLQQANIVPLFGAGEVDAGIPYYTMPFVEGESLRHRLDGRPFHPADAVAILRDVARALEYAHAHGVVHRDIKPENVLLSGGTAVVTDFGIAKALSASKTQAPGGTLTVVGTSLGTPAYMAPEQAVGDEVDARADIYAWGVMAYEMLVGAHPFAGKQTAQQYITAHLAEAPKALRDLRGDVHPEFSALVMKALEKEPAKRFASATELLSALNHVVTSGATTPHQIASAPRAAKSRFSSALAYRVIGVALLVTVILGGIGAFASRQRDSVGLASSQPFARRVYVGSFQKTSEDRAVAGVEALLERDIARRLTETNVAELLVSDDNSPTKTAQIAKAKSIGAGIVVAGSTLRVGDRIQVSADLIAPGTGRILRVVGPFSAPLDNPTPAVAELRERVLGTIALMLDSAMNDVIPAPAAQTPTYAAFREFQAGEQLSNVARYADAFQNYFNAYRIDSTFTFAAVRAARGFLNSQRCVQADSLGNVLLALGERLSGYERAILERNFARCSGDWQAAYQAARKMVEIAPESPDAQVVAGSAAMNVFRFEEAVNRFMPIALRQGFTGYYTVLGYHFLGKYAEGRKLAEAVGHKFPGSAGGYRSLILAYAATRDTVELRKVADELAGIPISSNTVSPLPILQLAATEAVRHGLRRDGERINQQILELLMGEPAEKQRLGDIAEIYYQQGKWKEAAATLEVADKRASGLKSELGNQHRVYLQGLRGRLYARTGRTVEADSMARYLSSLHYKYDRGFPKLCAAQIAAALGQRDVAVRLLREAIRGGISFVDTPPDAYPDLVSLTGYPPYEELFKPRR